MKTCTKCGILKDQSDFRKSTRYKSGLRSHCIDCERVYSLENYQKNKDKASARYKKYYEANREKILTHHKSMNEANQQKRGEYREKNKDRIKQTGAEYYEKNRVKLLEKGRLWREKNKDKIKGYYLKDQDKIKAKAKNHREANSEETKYKKKLYTSRTCSSEWRVAKIPHTDVPMFVDGLVSVLCKNCGVRFNPTNAEVIRRINAFNGAIPGELNFYCSDVCREECPLFWAKTNHPDPRVPKPRNYRSCSNDAIKELQCDKAEGQSYCEKCGDFVDVELHHTLTVAGTGAQSVNAAGHILLCWRCHREVHKICTKGAE